jgi:hypothetical protein
MSRPPSAADQVRFLRNLQRILEEGDFTRSARVRRAMLLPSGTVAARSGVLEHDGGWTLPAG